MAEGEPCAGQPHEYSELVSGAADFRLSGTRPQLELLEKSVVNVEEEVSKIFGNAHIRFMQASSSSGATHDYVVEKISKDSCLVDTPYCPGTEFVHYNLLAA